MHPSVSSEYSHIAAARHQTIVTDPEILEELRKRKEAQRAQASPSRAAEVKTQGEQMSCQVPEDGWLFSASEEPFHLRTWRSSLATGEDQESLVARVASDWGMTAVSCKGCKSRGDSTVGQDNFLIAKLANDWKAVCVFDGHGVDGHWPAWRVTETIPHFLQEEPCSKMLKSGDGAKALTHAFKAAQEDLEAYALESGKDLHLCGTTATVALIPPGHDSIWVATAGDSRAMLVDQQRVLNETSDHKATRKDEADRIKDAGGQVIATEYDDGTEDCRIAPKDMVSPQIAISRSLGDMIFKDSGVTAVPEVVHWQVSSSESLLVICSDGVWEFLSSEEVREILQESLQGSAPSAPEAAHLLLQQARRAWMQHEAFYCDDITVVLASLTGTCPVQNQSKTKEPCPGCQNQSCIPQ
ncbi:Probable protein phosphatase 2C 64 (OsPP2C64) [Durusdinium trenchii]|uniref:Probable protein phosphatase 2C 64 (OsPP2C64) n=1 Tax=Durusdinium trenchii TaxID=1381693 RepID=A0ABP0IN91_9DINO